MSKALKSALLTSAVALSLVTALASATLPTTVPAPPGNVAHTRSCKVGDTNELVRYRSGLGCLLGNATLAALSPNGIDETWARAVQATSLELARYGSTVSPAEPEALYVVAATVDLATIAASKTSPALHDSACSAATSAAEEACVAYFCSTNDALRVESPALVELGKRIQSACAQTPPCLPKDLDVNRVACNAAWQQKQEGLATLIRARQDAANGALGPAAAEAVAHWTDTADQYADQVRDSVLKSDYAPLPALAAGLNNAAAPALLTVEKGRTETLKKKLAESIVQDKTLNATSCAGAAAAACRLQQRTSASKVTQLKDTVQFQEQKLSAVKTATDPAARLKILSQHFE